MIAIHPNDVQWDFGLVHPIGVDAFVGMSEQHAGINGERFAEHQTLLKVSLGSHSLGADAGTVGKLDDTDADCVDGIL